MAEQIIVAQEIQERYDCLLAESGASRQKGKRVGRDIANKATEKIGQQVFIRQQVQTLAYLLGFEDPSCGDGEGSLRPGEPYGVSLDVFRSDIEPLIPEHARIKTESVLSKRTQEFHPVVYTRKGVEVAFEALDDEFKLDYNPKRFEQAATLV